MADEAVMSPVPRGARRWRGTRLRVGAAFFVLAALLFGGVGLLSGEVSRRHSMDDAGAALGQLGTRLALSLDIGMHERLREVENLAAIESLLGTEIDSARWRALIERLQASLPHYTWIGVTDTEGRVQAATGGLLEGRDVSKRPWFAAGLVRSTMVDVHEALLLQSLLPPQPAGEPLRLIDFATPLRSTGRTQGVLGAHLSLRWAEERRQLVAGSLDPGRGIELMVLDAGGQQVLGPQEPALPEGLAGASRAPALMRWGDGELYLTAAVKSPGYAGQPGLGWTMLVRQPERTALAAAAAVQRRIWALGALGAALFGLAGWWLAGRLTAPLARLAAQASAVAPSGGPQQHDEVAQLARSIGALATELQERESELLGLEEANADLQSFSRAVSHDLKGPIGGMGMVLRHLQEQQGDKLDAGGRRSIAVLVQECERLRVLIDELLMLAQAEQRPLQRQPVVLREQVEQVLAALRDGPDADAARRCEVRLGQLPSLPVDAVLMRQVWHNLLANAVKFSARANPPRVELSAQHGQEGWTFCVADNGAGFDPAQAHRLFGVFQRLHRASEFAGSGVGLSIVKRVVERHGGRVWAEGEPGRGARFFFTLASDQK